MAYRTAPSPATMNYLHRHFTYCKHFDMLFLVYMRAAIIDPRCCRRMIVSQTIAVTYTGSYSLKLTEHYPLTRSVAQSDPSATAVGLLSGMHGSVVDAL